MTISSTFQKIKKYKTTYKNAQIHKWITIKVYDVQNTNR